VQVQEFLERWGYVGVFFALLATGVGFPLPEELPVVIGGVLAGHAESGIQWWAMLPVCIAGVVIGDSFLYTIGRFWGPRLLRSDWIRRRVFPPDRLAKIEHNFHVYGVKILLFARMTPGVRAPIFFTAGMTRLSLARFLLADGLYAVPGVSFLFFLGWWFGDSMVAFVEGPVEKAKTVIILVVIVAVIGYFAYRMLRKPAVTGDPSEMPPLAAQVTHTLESVTSKFMHPLGGEHHPKPGTDGQSPGGPAPVPAADPEEPAPPA
jgi:membrane protein DedA with SNARE-associated domain